MAKNYYKTTYFINCFNQDGTIEKLTRSTKEGAIRLAYKMFATLLYVDVRIFPLREKITR